MSEGKKKCLKVLVCYTAMETYCLPIEAKAYRPTDDRRWTERASIEAYLADHRCEPDKEGSDDWRIADCQEVEE
jgi:hypothetical protein